MAPLWRLRTVWRGLFLHYVVGGGFVLKRCCRRRRLVELPVPQGGYTVAYLKHLSGLNKAVCYIVPIQADLTEMVEQEALSHEVRY